MFSVELSQSGEELKISVEGSHKQLLGSVVEFLTRHTSLDQMTEEEFEFVNQLHKELKFYESEVE